jgi:hypothetical protein
MARSKTPKSNAKALPSATSTEKPQISFKYIKGNDFRVVHADGAIGGTTPTLDIHMTIFSQRKPIPRKSTHEVNSDGQLGPEIVSLRDGDIGLVRELETDVVMNLSVAKALVVWLQRHIDEIEESINQNLVRMGKQQNAKDDASAPSEETRESGKI